MSNMLTGDLRESQALFAHRLREEMKERKLRQQDLAEATGKLRQTISLYLSGQSVPDIDTLRTLAVFLGCSSDYLLGLSEYKSEDDRYATPDDLGLNEISVRGLKFVKSTESQFPAIVPILNYLLTHPAFFELISDLARVRSDTLDAERAKTKVSDPEDLSMLYRTIGGGYSVIAGDEAVYVSEYRAEKLFRQIIEDVKSLEL